MPEIPEFPRGLTLTEKRRWVSVHGIPIERWRIRQCKAVGIEWMKWLDSGLDDVCRACQEASGVPIPIDEMDVDGHLAACTCPDSCMCVCVAAEDPDKPIDEDEIY